MACISINKVCQALVISRKCLIPHPQRNAWQHPKLTYSRGPRCEIQSDSLTVYINSDSELVPTKLPPTKYELTVTMRLALPLSRKLVAYRESLNNARATRRNAKSHSCVRRCLQALGEEFPSVQAGNFDLSRSKFCRSGFLSAMMQIAHLCGETS